MPVVLERDEDSGEEISTPSLSEFIAQLQELEKLHGPNMPVMLELMIPDYGTPDPENIETPSMFPVHVCTLGVGFSPKEEQEQDSFPAITVSGFFDPTGFGYTHDSEIESEDDDDDEEDEEDDLEDETDDNSSDDADESEAEDDSDSDGEGLESED